MAQEAYDKILNIYPEIEDEVNKEYPSAPNGNKLIEAFSKSNASVQGFDLVAKESIDV